MRLTQMTIAVPEAVSPVATYPAGYTTLPWFALHIKSNFEKVTSTILAAKGLEVYFPSFTQKKQWSDRVKVLEKPLFPGYLFCRFDPDHRLPVLMTQGVISIVGVSGAPEPISEIEIQSVQKMVASGLVLRPWSFQQVGQHVVVEKGPLAGTEGVILQIKGDYRLLVSIKLLQRSVIAEIDAETARASRPSAARSAFANQEPCFMQLS